MEINRFLKKAKAHEKKGQVEEAIQLYLSILESFPKNQETIQRLKKLRSEIIQNSSVDLKQDEINAVLVELAQTNSIVVRLKGGDPFIFGRGGEEAEYLIENNIPFEVVPGITSSSGCSAYAGIPLTHRDWAQSVRFVTGHSQAGKELDLNWESLADPDTTLVVYMGTVNSHIISSKLIEAGLANTTPVAIINNGTRPDQKVILSDLQTMPDVINENGIKGATLLVIGQVTALANKLDWYKG